MGIQDLATDYGLLPDYIEVPPNVEARLPGQPSQSPQTGATISLATTQSAPAKAAPPSLSAMDQRYAGSAYAPELRAAAATVRQEQAAFDALVKQSLEQPAEKPSQAELYFRLAAAFGTPTKTGNFFESLGVVGKEVFEYLKENRATESAARVNRLKTLLESRKISLQAAREELGNLRNLAVEEIKASGPQSPAGKQAKDEGLVPGTPAFVRRVNEIAQTGVDAKLAQLNATLVQTQAMLANMQSRQTETGLRVRAEERKEKESTRLTPKELDLKSETENVITAADSGLEMLSRAYKLNPNTFDTSLPDTLQRKALEAAGSKDPKLLRTRELENILGQQAITQLKTAFGGNPTEGERKILLDLQGLGAKSIEERSAILRNAYASLKSRREREQRRLNEITSGRYRETTPEPATTPEGE